MASDVIGVPCFTKPLGSGDIKPWALKATCDIWWGCTRQNATNPPPNHTSRQGAGVKEEEFPLGELHRQKFTSTMGSVKANGVDDSEKDEPIWIRVPWQGNY